MSATSNITSLTSMSVYWIFFSVLLLLLLSLYMWRYPLRARNPYCWTKISHHFTYHGSQQNSTCSRFQIAVVGCCMLSIFSMYTTTFVVYSSKNNVSRKQQVEDTKSSRFLFENERCRNILIFFGYAEEFLIIAHKV